MKILVTAFEPFGDREVNASLKVLDEISELNDSYVIIKEILSVDHDLAPEKLRTLLVSYSPNAVICLGEAGRIDWIQLEHVAINWMDYRIADNGGKIIHDKKINESGCSAYFSSLPLRLFEQTLSEASIPVDISMSAGTFLCNQIFYVLMDYLESNGVTIPAGFIHLPAGIIGDENTSGKCTLSLAIEGINMIISTLVFQCTVSE